MAGEPIIAFCRYARLSLLYARMPCAPIGTTFLFDAMCALQGRNAASGGSPVVRSGRQIPHAGEHIVDKDAVAGGRVIDHDVGDRPNRLAVLNDGRARQ